jgi:hypothetical protein
VPAAAVPLVQESRTCQTNPSDIDASPSNRDVDSAGLEVKPARYRVDRVSCKVEPAWFEVTPTVDEVESDRYEVGPAESDVNAAIYKERAAIPNLCVAGLEVLPARTGVR